MIISNLGEDVRRFIKLKEAHGELAPHAGIAISVISGNQVIYQDTFGFSNHEAKTRISLNTVFQISSLTKAFTAFAHLMLNDSGFIDGLLYF